MLRRLLCLRISAPIGHGVIRTVTRSIVGATENGSSKDQTLQVPLVSSRSLVISKESRALKPACQAWLETLKQVDDVKLGLLDLHPEVFGVFPRLHVVYENLYWQGRYRTVDYRSRQTRSEVHTQCNAKPWPQKGTGRARHGSRRSPLFKAGSQVKGPRGPESFFYILPRSLRIQGLTTMLSIKLAQGDLHIVDDFDILSLKAEYLEDLMASRNWGSTALFVSREDVAPEPLALACASGRGFTIMPAYGLNVWSMVHHDALIMTQSALEQVEEKLLAALHSRAVDDYEVSSWQWDDRTGTHFADSDSFVEHRF